MNLPGNKPNGGPTVARFQPGTFISVAGGNRLADAFNGGLPPGKHGQNFDDSPPRPFATFRIAGAVQDFTNFRWKYSLIEQVKSGTEWDGWQDAAGATPVNGYNYLEVPNGDSALPGNFLSGILMDSNTASGIAAIRTDSIVLAMAVPCVDDDGNSVIEFWFTEPNDLNVACT